MIETSINAGLATSERSSGNARLAQNEVGIRENMESRQRVGFEISNCRWPNGEF